MRAVRSRGWFVGVAAVAVGAFLIGLFALSGNAQAAVCIIAVLVLVFTVVRALDDDSSKQRESHMKVPPGGPGPGAS